MLERSLEEVLKPLPVEAFFREVWGKNYLVQRGDGSKFRELLPWNEINRILGEHRLDHPRLRLAKGGDNIAPSCYTTYQISRRGVQIPRLRSTELTDLIRDGATLIVDAIDEMYTPLRELAEALERTFREYVQVNAYAGWGRTKGFDLHWDDHEVFVMQVEGRKAWKVYGQSRKHPLFRDKAEEFKAPTTVLWEGVLERGDLLYIPRGWWHVATAVGEPTLHLTFGFNVPTGSDLLNWLGEALVECEVFRKDLPIFSAPEARKDHMKQLRDAVNEKWDDEMLTRFLAERDTLARQRPHFSLPFSATKEVVPDRDSLNIQCVLPRQPVFERKGRVTVVRAIGKMWTFAGAAEPLLKVLLSRKPVSLGKLKRDFGEQFSPDNIVQLVRDLAVEGALIISE